MSDLLLTPPPPINVPNVPSSLSSPVNLKSRGKHLESSKKKDEDELIGSEKNLEYEEEKDIDKHANEKRVIPKSEEEVYWSDPTGKKKAAEAVAMAEAYRKRLKEREQAKERSKKASLKRDIGEIGDSLKDEDMVESRELMRQRLFPIQFSQWAKDVQEINVAAVKPYRGPETATFVIFCFFYFIFVTICLLPDVLHAEYHTISSAILDAFYLPYRTRHIEGNLERIHLAEQWETFRDITAIDEVAAWFYQILPSFIPSVWNFNIVLGGIRLTQRRMLIDHITNPIPLLGAYSGRWASAHGINPYASFDEHIESEQTPVGIFDKHHGFRGNGGSVIWLDGKNPQEAINTLSALLAHDYFTRETASLAVEFILTNVYFPHVAYIEIVFTSDGSGLIHKDLNIQLVGNIMSGINTVVEFAAIAFILIASVLPLWFPLKRMFSMGFLLWFKKYGICETQSLIMCTIGTWVVIIFYIVEAVLSERSFNLDSSESLISYALHTTDLTVINGQMAFEHENIFNSLVDSFIAIHPLKLTKLVVFAFTTFSIVWRLCRHVGYSISHRFTSIFWSWRQFFTPALVVCFLLFSFIIGFALCNQVAFEQTFFFSTFRHSFVATLILPLYNWPPLKLWDLHWLTFFILNIFFCISFVGGTVEQELAFKLNPLRSNQKMFRYTWYKVKYDLQQFYFYMRKRLLTCLSNAKLIDSAKLLDIEKPEPKTHSMNYLDETTDEVPLSTSPETLKDSNPPESLQYIFLTAGQDETVKTPDSELYFYLQTGGVEAVEATAAAAAAAATASPHLTTAQPGFNFRWDWYDPYRPPSFWRLAEQRLSTSSTKSANKRAIVPDAYISPTEKTKPFQYEHRAHPNTSYFDEEFLTDIKKATKDLRPDVQYIQTYLKSFNFRRTFLQLICIVAFVVIAVLAVSNILVPPRDAFEAKEAIYSVLSSSTWTASSDVWPATIFFSPRRNLFSITTTQELLLWLEFALPEFLFRENEFQQTIVFNNDSFKQDGSFPILISNWVAGLSATSTRLALFRTRDRAHGNMEGPFTTEGGDYLTNLGFTTDLTTNSFFLYLPADRPSLTTTLRALIQGGFIDINTAILDLSTILLNVNLKHYYRLRIYFKFPSTGSIDTFVDVQEISKSFFFRDSTVWKNPIIISACVVMILTLLGEAHAVYKLYQHEQALYEYAVVFARRGYIRNLPYKCSFLQSLLIYSFEISVFDHAAFITMLVFLGLQVWAQHEYVQDFLPPLTITQMQEFHRIIEPALSYTWLTKVIASWLTCFSLLRLTEFFRTNKRFAVTRLTILAYIPDLACALTITFALVLGSALILNTVFGSTVVIFRTYPISIYTCFSMITGHFNFFDVYVIHPYLSLFIVFPIWVVLFISILNMFTAVVVRSFSCRIAEVEEAERLGLIAPKSLWENLKSCWSGILNSLGLKFKKQKRKHVTEMEMGSVIEATQKKNHALQKIETITSAAYQQPVRLTQMSDKAYNALSSASRAFAENSVSELIDRFRKLNLGLSVFGPTEQDQMANHQFIADLEDKLYFELLAEFRSLKVLEGRLRHQLNIYENIVKEEQMDVARYVTLIESAIEEAENDLKEKEEEYNKIVKTKKRHVL